MDGKLREMTIGRRHYMETMKDFLIIKAGALFTCSDCGFSHIGGKPYNCFNCGSVHKNIKEVQS